MSRPFVHLHNHTDFSLLDGACHIPKMMSLAEKYEWPAVAITDHGNLFGAVQFYNAAKKKGVKPIIGCEVYVAKGSHKDKSEQGGYHHLLLLCENETGYRNLMKLVSTGFLDGFYYKPRIDKDLLAKHSEGLICTSACLAGDLAKALVEDEDYDAAKRLAYEYRDIFGADNFFLEIQDHGLDLDRKLIPQLHKLSRETGIPLVATNDAHYLTAEDAPAHEALLCVQTGKTLSDPNRMRFETNHFYLKSRDEMLDILGGDEAPLDLTWDIAQRCNLDIKPVANPFPEFGVPTEHTIDTYFEYVARQGLEKRWAQLQHKQIKGGLRASLEEYSERLDYEISIIQKMKYSGYFLIVWDFIRYAKSQKIPVGPGRGSAAGSLVAYAMEITNIDPLQYSLLFERFLNPERVSMPDIDIDFCMNRRGDVIQYVTEKYGREQVAQIITFNTMAAKAAIKDCGRAMDMPYGDVDRIAKLIPATIGITIDKALEEQPELAKIYASDVQIRELIDTAKKLEGLVRGSGVHAAGVVIAPRPLTELVPIAKTKNDEIVTAYDMKAVEKMGLLKMDFLGLTTLTVITDALKLIEENRGIVLDIETIPLDDKLTYEKVFHRALTSGVFQFESGGMRDVLRRYKPESIEDLTALNALYRPGPIQGGMIDDFIERKWGRRNVEYMLPDLEPLLKETLGVIVYQEQVMQIANVVASYSLGEADLLRRAMGKKDPAEMAKQRDRFMSGAAALGHPKDGAGELFDMMEKFAGYGFNKSHSAAYALLAYQTAYLKTHYPVEFMAALLTSEISKPENVVKYIQECKEMEIAVEPPDVRLSGAHFTPSGDAIRFGLTAIKNVGGNAIESILAVRRDLEKEGKSFTTFWEFCEKVDLRLLNKRVLESLIKAGALDAMGTRAQLTAAVDRAIERGQKAQKDAAQGQHGLFGLFNEAPAAGHGSNDLPRVPDWEEKQRLDGEKEVLGFFVSGHPLDKYAEKLRNLSGVVTSAAALEMKPPPAPKWGQQRDPGDEISIAGVLVGMRAQKSKRNDKMYAQGHIEDSYGKLEVICFAKDFDKLQEQLKTEAAVLLRGTLIGEEDSAPKLAISGLQPLDEVQIRLPKGVRLRLNLDLSSEEIFATLKEKIDAAPGPGKVMMHLQKKGQYEVILEPAEMKVAADRGWVESVEELLGRGAVQVLS